MFAAWYPNLTGQPWRDIDDARLAEDWNFGCELWVIVKRARRSEAEVLAPGSPRLRLEQAAEAEISESDDRELTGISKTVVRNFRTTVSPEKAKGAKGAAMNVVPIGIAKRVILPDSFLGAMGPLGLGHPGNPLAFKFRRTKLGTEVNLLFDGKNRFTLNLSVQSGLYHKNIAEARSWAFKFAKQHGFEPKQVKRAKQHKRPELRLV